MNTDASSFRVGLIVDTHGLLRPELSPLLAGCRLILHAGDVGKPDVLTALEQVAPVIAVRGNNDHGAWAEALPLRSEIVCEAVPIMLIHDLSALDRDPSIGAFRVIVSGHSHRPKIEHRNGVLYVNPGSAGPRRFSLPISIGLLEIASGQARAEILPLSG